MCRASLPTETVERPSPTEPKHKLKEVIGASAKQALEKLMGDLSVNSDKGKC